MGIVSLFYTKTILEKTADDGSRKSYSPEDFPGMQQEAYSFVSEGNTLRGFYYRYDDCRQDELLIFCHGIGGCARGYMKSIELLCRAGFKVLAYDNTGSFNSDGESLVSLSHSLVDLNSAVESLKQSGEIKKYKKIYTVGHSWGGYAAANIANYQDCIDKTVVISGFRKVESEIDFFSERFPALFRSYMVRKVLQYEKDIEPDYYGSDALDAVNAGKTKYMFVHSKDDTVVSFEHNTKYIIDHTGNKDVRYLLMEGKKHHPYATQAAVDYKESISGQFKIKRSKRTPEEAEQFRNSIDWDLYYAQDLSVWKEITDFLQE